MNLEVDSQEDKHMSDRSSPEPVEMPIARSPVVSIGMPVYNGENTLADVLDSLLGQSFKDFELIIADNASTDSTPSICTTYAARDQRIRYVRHDKNLGAEANFHYVFNQASTEYFMWAAADDVRSRDFLAVNLDFLRSHPDHVASTSPVRFAGGNFDGIKMGDRSLDHEDAHRRVAEFFQVWHANGRFYSLFRRQAVATWPHLADSFFLGADWTLVTHLASMGKLHRADEGWVELGTKGVSHTVDIFARYRRTRLDWLLPFHRMSSDTLRIVAEAPLALRLAVLRRLIYLNYKAFKGQRGMRRRRAAQAVAEPG